MSKTHVKSLLLIAVSFPFAVSAQDSMALRPNELLRCGTMQVETTLNRLGRVSVTKTTHVLSIDKPTAATPNQLRGVWRTFVDDKPASQQTTGGRGARSQTWQIHEITTDGTCAVEIRPSSTRPAVDVRVVIHNAAAVRPDQCASYEADLFSSDIGPPTPAHSSCSLDVGFIADHKQCLPRLPACP